MKNSLDLTLSIETSLVMNEMASLVCKEYECKSLHIVSFGIGLFKSHFANPVETDGIAANVSCINLLPHHLLLKCLFNVPLTSSKKTEGSILNMYACSCGVCNGFLARKDAKSELVDHDAFSYAICCNMIKARVDI